MDLSTVSAMASLVAVNIIALFIIFKKLKSIADDKKVRGTFCRHPFFVKAYDYINRVIPKIELKDKAKEFVVKQFLTIKIQALADSLSRFSPETDSCDHEEIMMLVNSALEQAYSQSAEVGIPEVFISKYQKWFKINYSYVARWSESICTSKYFDTSEEKFSAFLDLMSAVMVKTISDAEQTMNTFNGEIAAAIAANNASK